jgi:hypothetical protein
MEDTKLIRFLEKLACWTGALGAILIASNTGAEIYGYISFIISEIAFIYYAKLTNQYELLKMNAIFILISFYGFYNFFPGFGD